MKLPALQFKILCFLILAGSTCLLHAQAGYYTIATEKSGTAFSFPVLSSDANKAGALKINRLLQLAELHVLKGTQKRHIFERITTSDGGLSGKHMLYNYTVFANTSKIVSIQFKESVCEAECLHDVKYYNFNAGNGDVIHLKDLFTDEGYQAFFKYITAKRVARLGNELQKLPPSTKEMMLGVSECYGTSNLNDFYFKDNMLYIDGENCFYNAQKDEPVKRLDNFAITEFKDHLNDYGKCLLSGGAGNIADFRSFILPQLFESAEPSDTMMVMVLSSYYMEDMKGVYAYINKPGAVPMEGRMKGNELYLAEYEAPVSETPYFNGVYDGQRINGLISDRRQTIRKPVNLIRR